MYYGGYLLARDNAEQIRAEVQHNRLEAALANNHIQEEADVQLNIVTRVANLMVALIK